MDTGQAVSNVYQGKAQNLTFQASFHRQGWMDTRHKNEGIKEVLEMRNPIWEEGEGNSQMDGS